MSTVTSPSVTARIRYYEATLAGLEQQVADLERSIERLEQARDALRADIEAAGSEPS